MMGVKLAGFDEVVVIAPPSTHEEWEKYGVECGITVSTMSHAKFRMPATKLSRHVAVIADEFHMFGGHTGKGWKKLQTLGRHLQAPLLLLSATPQYNDAERVYCVQSILSPHNTKGGFLQFLYDNCYTEQTPFSMTPIVTGFKYYPTSEEFLASLERVYYVPDDTIYKIDDVPYLTSFPVEFDKYSYDARNNRIMASQMEKRHTAKFQGLVRRSGLLGNNIYNLMEPHLKQPVLVFSASSRIAEAASRSLDLMGVEHRLITGKTSKKDKARILNEFRAGQVTVLIGTATLATGTDGLDRVCDTLLILDDTDDDALRRQLVGRIMPRGDAVVTSAKRIIRLVAMPSSPGGVSP
jgi:hypothetical protein